MVDSHQGGRYDADPGQGAGQGETSHPQVRNRAWGWFFDASQTEPAMNGARGKGLTVRDRKPKGQG